MDDKIWIPTRIYSMTANDFVIKTSNTVNISDIDDGNTGKSRQFELSYFLVPFGLFLLIILICLLLRLIPAVQFYMRKPVFTKSETVQIEYKDKETKVEQLLDVEMGANSIIVDSKIIKRESLLSLLAKDNQIVVVKELRKKESNRAIIVSGHPPEYY